MASKLHKVFVYGTLKRNEPNHQWFSKDEAAVYKFISNATTVDKYPLIIGTKYNIPFLLFKPGVGHNVKGELYEVDDKVFANLDILEDHPNYYVREIKGVQRENGEKTDAWIYFIKNFKEELLQQEMYNIYSDLGSHGRRYIAKYLRDSNFGHNSGILNDS